MPGLLKQLDIVWVFAKNGNRELDASQVYSYLKHESVCQVDNVQRVLEEMIEREIVSKNGHKYRLSVEGLKAASEIGLVAEQGAF